MKTNLDNPAPVKWAETLNFALSESLGGRLFKTLSWA